MLSVAGLPPQQSDDGQNVADQEEQLPQIQQPPQVSDNTSAPDVANGETNQSQVGESYREEGGDPDIDHLQEEARRPLGDDEEVYDEARLEGNVEDAAEDRKEDVDQEDGDVYEEEKDGVEDQEDMEDVEEQYEEDADLVVGQAFLKAFSCRAARWLLWLAWAFPSWALDWLIWNAPYFV